MPALENSRHHPPVWGRKRQAGALLWLAGVLFFGGLALTPLRLPFLEYPLVGALSLDYVLHSLGFAWLASGFPLLFDSRLLLWLSPSLLALLAVDLEFWQMHIPNRRFSEKDIAAGVVGVCLGALLGWGVRTMRARRKRRDAASGEKPA